jgi:tetratricopeptide (TPR) repeat protein
LYCKGYKFDCVLDGYGAIDETEVLDIAILKKNDANHYFELGMEAYNNQNLGMAIVHFSTAIKIDPNDPNAWYSRAIIKDELYTWKAARRDYDKAIELAPDFIDAIVNRAANKDEAGEFDSAIEDYNKVINIDPQNVIAYFNRVNSKHNKNDRIGACEDWKKAKELGAEYAQERIDEHCR